MNQVSTPPQTTDRSSSLPGVGLEAAFAALLLLAPLVASLAQLASPVDDADLWWHLAAGRWMAEHGTVPSVDPFLTGGHESVWLNYSWSLDRLWWWGYQRVELAAPLAYAAVMSALILGLCAALPQRNRSQLLRRSFLGALGFITIHRCLTPRSFLVTMLFSGVVLLFVRRVRAGMDPKYGFLLVPLFAMWPNMHVEFIYGLFFLGLAIVEQAIESRRARVSSQSTLKTLCAVAAACAAATALNPFGLRLHSRVISNIFMYGSYDLVNEMRSNAFRSLTDYLLLVWFGAAVYTLARRRDATVYPWAALTLATYMSFHSQRALWMVVFVALDIVGDLPLLSGPQRANHGRWDRMLLPLGAALTVALFVISTTNARERLVPKDSYPFAAIDFVRERHLKGPIYNDWNWGGFCRFALPDVVGNVDGRGDPESLKVAVNSWSAKPGWRDDRHLDAAGFVLANSKSPLCELLRLDTRFHIAFEDQLAVVFVPQR